MSALLLTEHHLEFLSLKGLTCLVCVLQPWSPVGKGAMAVVASPAFAGPTFLAEYAFRRVTFSRLGSFFFELTSDFIQSSDNLLKHSERCTCH